ncbi:MAG: serine protease [Betaproteobacteria bacterium]|nr:MAG: serine protease [Betaproteobacteria bacterium]
MTAHSKTVSLALGGGGARGLAHIGVIRWLTENGYVIRSIAGSSMGALIGGIYAASKLEVYADWALALDRMRVLRLLDPAFGRPGLFKGERIMGVLRKLIGDRDIEDLPVAFTAVATDLESGEEVWLREGRLFDAIRGSMATPLMFTPFVHGARTLLDGALVNPLPVEAMLSDPADLTVAVSLAAARSPPPPSAAVTGGHGLRQRLRAIVEAMYPAHPPVAPAHGMIDIALASIDIMQAEIARLRLAAFSADVIVEIPHDACGYLEFWRAKELIGLGRERTAQAFAAAGTPRSATT